MIHSTLRLCLTFFLLLILNANSSLGQWLDWEMASEERLVLSTVANNDDEEKDIWTADLNKDGWMDVIVV